MRVLAHSKLSMLDHTQKNCVLFRRTIFVWLRHCGRPEAFVSHDGTCIRDSSQCHCLSSWSTIANKFAVNDLLTRVVSTVALEEASSAFVCSALTVHNVLKDTDHNSRL